MNIRRLTHVMHTVENREEELALVSIDISKAFNTVDWLDLKRVLEAMGIGPQYRAWVNLLYTIHVGKVCSEKWDICRGAGQGCPLSPLLFAIATEPMAVWIRQEQVTYLR